MQVVILGGGFAGLRAARALGRGPFQVTLVDRRNFHLFQPLLYQVATGGLSPANVAAPLRTVLKGYPNVRVLLGEAVDVDLGRRRVVLREGELPYDVLLVATGCQTDYYGHRDWELWAPGLKTVEDATEIRRRVLLAFERAESVPAERDAWLTFVIVGGGATGVELAGTLAEIARYTLRREYRHVDPAAARILLVEGRERVLPGFAPPLSARAEAVLKRLGVTVRTGTQVTAVTPRGVTLAAQGAEPEHVAARTVLWAAGIRATPLGPLLARKGGAELDPIGRVRVGPDLTLPGHPEVFVLGDLAAVAGPDGAPLPAIAPVALQAGAYVGELLRRRVAGRPTPPFRYRHRGMMCTLGRRAAVAEIGRFGFNGWPAWLAWLFVHLAQLVLFQNRVLVFIQWAWNYFTWSRSSRLIINYQDARRTDEP